MRHLSCQPGVRRLSRLSANLGAAGARNSYVVRIISQRWQACRRIHDSKAVITIQLTLRARIQIVSKATYPQTFEK